MNFAIQAPTDVLVAGGGTAGTVAAIAAARAGARVTLVERYGFLGGVLTGGLVGPMMTFHAGEKQIIAGIPQEIVCNLGKNGAMSGHVPDTIGYCSTLTPFDPEELKWVLLKMVEDHQSIELLLHTFAIDAITQGYEVKGVIAATKSGIRIIPAKRTIDCTGDGDVAARAGCAFCLGREEDQLIQPMTLMFRMGGVDMQAIVEYMQKYPDQFSLRDDLDLKTLTVDKVHSVAGFYDLVREAKKADELDLPRNQVLFFPTGRSGEVRVNMTRVLNANSTDADDLTKAERIARQQVRQLVPFLKKRIPGFQASWLIDTGAYVGSRESRRVLGEYVMTADDIVNAKKFSTGIACGSFPIDIHDPAGDKIQLKLLPRGEFYNIPYETLIPRNMENILVAGRCISATHEAAASIRLSPTAMALGQAAGVAAALSLKQDVLPRDVNIRELQSELKQQGAYV